METEGNSMRSLASIAGVGVLLLAGSAYSQSFSEHAAAAAGATIGSAAGKPMSNALSGILGQVNDSAAAAASTGAKAAKATIPSARTSEDKSAQTNRAGGPGSFSPGFAGGSSSSDGYVSEQSVARRRSTPLRAVPQPVGAAAPVAAEPIKEPSLEEVASVKLGTTEKDVFTALGQPESRVIVPDDDGHMRESLQYWASGKQLGTIRVDNGQVVKVEVRAQN